MALLLDNSPEVATKDTYQAVSRFNYHIAGLNLLTTEVATLAPSGVVHTLPLTEFIAGQPEATPTHRAQVTRQALSVFEMFDSKRFDIPETERELSHAEVLAHHTRVSQALVGVFEQLVPGPEADSLEQQRTVFVALPRTA